MSGTPARPKLAAAAAAGPKQGPLRATMPISSATKEGSGLRSVSPVTASRARPDASALGQRSPGAADYKGKLQPCNRGIAMRRTASLDAIYLRGFFPRDGSGQVVLHRDRATQTEISISLDTLPTAGTAAEVVDDKLSRLTIRARRRSIGRESANFTSAIGEQSATATQTTTASVKANAPKSSRSSEEGLNQEIERIILRSESDTQCSDRLQQPTPEGRKAPVADLLRTRCANTQTPPMRFPTPLEDSQDSSPDQYASPRINKFQREPPDGCERVLLKPVKSVPLEAVPPPRSFFTLTPSSGSAFECLCKNVDEEDDSPIVPDDQPNLS